MECASEWDSDQKDSDKPVEDDSEKGNWTQDGGSFTPLARHSKLAP